MFGNTQLEAVQMQLQVELLSVYAMQTFLPVFSKIKTHVSSIFNIKFHSTISKLLLVAISFFKNIKVVSMAACQHVC